MTQDVHWQRGCQYGNHGEPFLWFGSGNDIVDIAVFELIQLFQKNPRLANEAAEFIFACKADAEQDESSE